VSRRWPLLLAALAIMSLASAVRALAPSIAQVEISQLLAAVGTSGCEFNRNGSWYDATIAESHLRDKYQLLLTRGDITTAETFIDNVATRSSLTGIPYKLRCLGGAEFQLSLWLRDELLRIRATTSVSHPSGA
jgi:hypothetical protein